MRAEICTKDIGEIDLAHCPWDAGLSCTSGGAHGRGARVLGHIEPVMFFFISVMLAELLRCRDT